MRVPPSSHNRILHVSLQSWGLHVWGDTLTNTPWQQPLTPTGCVNSTRARLHAGASLAPT